MAEKDSGYFLMISTVILIAFISLIFATFDLEGKKLILNLILFVAIVVLSLFALVGIYYGMRWGWMIIVIVFSVIILDEILIYLVIRSVDIIHLILALASLAGIIISFGSIKGRKLADGIPEEKIEQIEQIEKLEKFSEKQKAEEKTIRQTPAKTSPAKKPTKKH